MVKALIRAHNRVHGPWHSRSHCDARLTRIIRLASCATTVGTLRLCRHLRSRTEIYNEKLHSQFERSLFLTRLSVYRPPGSGSGSFWSELAPCDFDSACSLWRRSKITSGFGLLLRHSLTNYHCYLSFKMPISVEPKMSRPHCDYRPLNQRFLTDCDFTKQYHFYYRKKLEIARPLLETNCRQKWDPDLPICNLAEVASRNSDMCIVIGTIFKHMKLQPNVIDELSKGQFDISSERYLGHYASKEDTLTLEDDEESVQLAGKIDPGEYVTGVTIALLGCPMNDGGRFVVEDVCFVDPKPYSISKPLMNSPNSSEPNYILVVSGLGFNSEMGKESELTRALQNLFDFINGVEAYAKDERSSRVSRVIVLGNSLYAEESAPPNDKEILGLNQDNVISKSQPIKSSGKSVLVTNLMDEFFANLARTISIDLMPGHSDPSSHLMPQQPFHPCMFPKASMLSTFSCTTNPHEAVYNDVKILATAGQNVDVISKFSNLSDPLEIMRFHLRWGNSAPSAPDNLYSVPYQKEDPFVMDVAPDIYIAGCQESFAVDHHVSDATKKSCKDAKTVLLTLPEFHKTFSFALVNLADLNIQMISFK